MSCCIPPKKELTFSIYHTILVDFYQIFQSKKEAVHPVMLCITTTYRGGGLLAKIR